MEEIHGSSVLILGFGREGKSTYAWLRHHYPNLHIDVADKNISKQDVSSSAYAGVTFYTGKQYLSHCSSYDTIIRSPGVSPYLPEIEAYIQSRGHVTSATNIFFSFVKGRTIGVTGTKGKSTTSSLIAHILSARHPDTRCIGNIGMPMLDALDTSNEETIYVIELSSHQLLDCRYSPSVAVMLNIVPEHLDYYPDFEIYTHAKANITNHQTSEDTLVYNPEHIIVRQFAEKTRARLVLYGETYHEMYRAYIQKDMLTTVVNNASVGIVSMHDIPLLGNTENILAAAAVATLFDVPAETIKERVSNFVSLPHRLELVGEYRGITFYNDSLSTIPQATVHALASLQPRVSTLIAGGFDRHVDYKELGKYLTDHPVTTLLLFPDTGKRIWEEIGVDSQKRIIKYDVQTMEEAVQLAYLHTPQGKVCVLSPGSASYNMFRDYADRGEQFKTWVRKLG